MSYERKKLGSRGEKRAANFLRKKNYHILGMNVKTRIGEIDILAQEEDTIIIVEVKTKTDSHQGAPEEMVDWKKQRKLIRLAKEVYQKYPNYDIRIDVVAIEGDEIRHHVNAVEDVAP